MKKSIKFLGLALVVTGLTGNKVYGSDFKDMPENWSRQAIENAIERGILQGDDGYIRPNDNLSRAEMSAMVNRVLDLEKSEDISGLDKSAWYYDDLSKLIGSGLLDLKGKTLSPGEKVSREEVFSVLGRALKTRSNKELSKFLDHDEIDEDHVDYIYALVDLGLIKGYEDNTLRPRAKITRAEFAQIMDKAYGLLLNIEEKKPGLEDIFEDLVDQDLKGEKIPFRIVSSEASYQTKSEGVYYYEEGDKLIVDICMQFNSGGYSFGIKDVIKNKNEITIVPSVKGPGPGVNVIQVINYGNIRLELDKKDIGKDYKIRVQGIKNRTGEHAIK